MCAFARLAALNVVLALALAMVFRLQGLSDAEAIFAVAAGLSVAQALHWALVCKRGDQ